MEEHMVPYTWSEGLTTSYANFPSFGTFRTSNTRQIAEYMEDKCYHKVFWSPKERVLLRELQQCFDGHGTMCATTAVDSNANLDIPLLLQPSSYSWSAPNMMNSYVYEDYDGDDDPQDHFHDPMSFAAGFRAPTMGQAKFSSQKTYLMEIHWLNNQTSGECGPNWSDSNFRSYHAGDGDGNDDTWSYDGCYPHYFNASFRSSPVATFCDGSVTQLSVEMAEKDDYVVANGNDSTNDVASYNGLWFRGSPDGEWGFFLECHSDWSLWSGHSHTKGGMTTGMDLLAN
jgi:hypothetical protein